MNYLEFAFFFFTLHTCCYSFRLSKGKLKNVQKGEKGAK